MDEPEDTAIKSQPSIPYSPAEGSSLSRQQSLRIPEKSPPAWKPEGVKKSNSNASALSIKSHDSMTVLGVHPFGSLRILEHDEDASTIASNVATVGDDDEDDDAPPPLEPPGSPTPKGSPSRQESKSPPNSARDLPIHHMGGGDVVLILELPEVYTVGYDSVSFTARHFGGVRDLPPGAHFFWATHPGGESARTGFWIVSTGSDNVHVLQWDKFQEGLLESSRAEARIQTENIESFHAKLVPYQDPAAVNGNGRTEGAISTGPDRDLRIWQPLTRNITVQVLNRVAGQQGTSWHVHTTDRIKGDFLLAAELELELRLSKTLLHSRELKFTFSQHARTFSLTEFGSDRSLAAKDPTSYIIQTLDGSDGDLTEDDIVGELQLAYILGMHLGNDSCIQQWWYMVLKLILKADALIEERPTLAAAFLQTIATQLSYGSDWLEGSILDYSEANNRDLRLALIVYKRRLEEALGALDSDAAPNKRVVGNEFARLEAAVVTFGWDIQGDYLRKGIIMLEDGEEVELEMSELEAEDERGEWAPEIVEFDENGRERGLVSWGD
ncbi:hypothetical protein PT974_05037 [Cladobotryum mycophilum]|uniref:AAR2 protein n=1 Tax=Cladobotryum mycophilum TaxID=491253 RepID=A0ABR0SQV8_9HYPO